MTEDNKDNSNNNSNSSLQIKPDDLKKRIDKGDDIFILDVRTPEEHKSWKVSYDRYQDSSVIPIDSLSSADSLKQIPKDKEIVTFCAHGNRSMAAAKTLSELGYNAKSIVGGLDGWNSVYDIASISDMDSSLRIWQIRRLSKGCMSYMVASIYDKSAIVIDATCEIDKAISKIVNENGLCITKLIDTHMHADHLSGATRLANKYGADVYISSLEGYDIKNGTEGMSIKSTRDGDIIQVGDGIVLEAIHTPGHTNGSMSFRLQYSISKTTINNSNNIDKGNNHNNYLFTGDTLFIDGIGRPDLHNKAQEFTRNLFNTYHQKILNLPDGTLILPAHFGGIFEHQKLISNTINSIKQETNLLSASEAEFIKFITDNTSLPQPMNYEEIISINKNMTLCDAIKQKDIEAGPNSCGISA
ncbi:MAG TPA: MBL fold metallo-hydrolase [Nitrososphaeraceae archaeon]|nr:MBL fold metallo-hydrolase [Nitrososphaeraceae archaeon]